jgi:broad specificity phosphatase PhoE
MKSLLILCRHGNTFEKGEKVVMVGAKEDLPLTAHGIEQARSLGRALASVNVIPDRVISGPLQRTKVFAEHLCAETRTSATVEIDPRLVEFDYGTWSGLSNEEIVALSGKDAFDAWQERSIRPAGVVFEPSPERARSEAQELLHDVSCEVGVCVVVTSNGRLREIGQLFAQSSRLPEHSYKVKTGHACVLERNGTEWRLLGWDLGVEALANLLRSEKE